MGKIAVSLVERWDEARFAPYVIDTGELPVSSHFRRIGAIALALGLAGAPAEAQFYGGGYWGAGGFGGASTPQGDFARGAGMYAMGVGRYNVDTAQATAINASTAMSWNQYIYNSRVESARLYHIKAARLDAKEKGNYSAIQTRLRTSPTEIDIANGSALNVLLNDLTDPKMMKNSVYYAGKVKLGGDSIRDIPFQYASEGISTSVHQLTQGGAPAALKRDEFGPDRDKLKAIAAELRREGEELGEHKPETIKKAKDQIMATKAKIEATFPQNSQERRDAEKYVKALYGLASMLETPAVNVLLAGVDKRPDASLGDLLDFMTAYNLRFGAADSARQKGIYRTLYMSLAKLRDEVVPVPGSSPPPAPVANSDAPGAVFEGMSYNHAEAKPPAPQPPK